MINLAENNRNLPKPSLADHRVPEPYSERVSVDVNTLQSQSNCLSLRTSYPTGRFYKNGWLEKHKRHVAPLKVKSNTLTVVMGDSIAAGLMRYKNVLGENFTRDTVNCGMGGDKTQNVLWRSKNIPLLQSLKFVVINCGTNNLDTDNIEKISGGLICIALLFQKRIKHLQIVVNGLIPRDAINTKRRQKLLEINRLLQDKCTNCTSVYFLKPETDWTTLDGGLNKTFYYKDNIHLLENGNKKLAISIKTKLDNIRVNCHEITINKKVVPTIKAVDYQRADYWRAVTTSPKNRQSNSTIKRNIKVRSPKCQLNFKTSTKILANQSQIQTKTQPETTSHPKHIVKTRNNDNISKNIKRKDAKQGKLHKPPTANPPKKKLATKCPLTKKQQTNTLLTAQINLHTTQIHRDDHNKWNTSCIKVRQPIRGRLKPSIDKTSEHDSSIYYGNHLLFFNVFYLMLFLNFRLFTSFFLQIFPAISTKSSKVYCIFLISVFAFFNISNLNVCHRNFDVSKNHFNCKTFKTEILDINRIRYNFGEMAETTYPHFDQHYSKHIFRNSMSHILQRAEENGYNIKFYLINFIISLLLLCKQFNNPKLKVIIIISSLLHLTITYNALSVSFNNVGVIMNLKNYPTNHFFTLEVLHITYKINEFSTNMHLKLLIINKMKYKSNHLYVKITLLLSADINLNLGPVARRQLNDSKFEAFNNKGLHLIHHNINSLLPTIDELRNIAKCSYAAVIGITETKLDNTVYDSEVTIDGYSIVRNDRNRKGGGVACYIRSNISYSRKTCLSDNLENIFFDLLFPRTKPISVGIFYKPPSQKRFLEQIITEFESLELYNELYILGDFNINLLFKRNCILNKTHEIKNHFREFSPEIKKYNEFCSIYGFKQLINCPTRITCNTSTLIDHILTYSQDNISQSGVIDTAISDHNMIYCTRKILKAKYNKHKELTFRSLRNYSVDVYKQALERASFPNYDNFHNPDIAYNDFINRLDCVVNTVAPFKTVRVKNNTSEWFDGEIADKIHSHDKLYRRFKLTKLHVDEEIYKEARNIVRNLIRKKKKAYFEEKEKKIQKIRKKVWKTLKQLGLPDKKSPSTNI